MPSKKNPGAEPPRGLILRQILKGHDGVVNRIAWSPDGKWLASPSMDETIRIWEVNTAKMVQRIFPRDGSVYCVAWSPDGKVLASGSSEGTIRLWNRENGALLKTFKSHAERVFTLSWSSDGSTLVSGSMDSTLLFWSVSKGDVVRTENNGYWVNVAAWSPDGRLLAYGGGDGIVTIRDALSWTVRQRWGGHSSYVVGLAWSPDGRLLASSSFDNTVRLWDPITGSTKNILEGHEDFVNCVSFSSDGRLLASKSNDGTVRIWRCDRWEMVAVLEELAPLEWRDFLSHQGLVQGWPSALAFHPKTNMLATLGDHDSVIRVWDLQLDVLLGAETSIISGHYANAKVVLVGDTGVGKTALAQVLTGKPFAPTESTQGRHVWTLEVQNVETEVGTREVRETLLWDLAGQPGYRLVHQLHLGEVAIALVVFDARSEIDPFGGVRYWARALRQAQFAHLSSAKIIKILVAARTDVAGISASRERINSFVKDCGFDAYFETSALTGRNIDELSEAIRSAIHWEDMVRVSSTALFQQIKTFLLEEKKTERLLSGEDDLYRTFLKVKGTQAEITDLSSQFAACVGRLEASGLVRRLGFGGLLLLQPEVLDAYASAIVSAAKDEPDGLGSISEATARVGNLELSVRERIADPAKERLLLIATIEDLLRHEIALREQGVDGPYLVFPTQFTRQKSELPVPESGSVIFTFGGAVINIYATLAVRLSHSGLFSKKEMWKNAAFYTAGVGGTCGMFIREVDEGSGELILLFDTAASEETRFNFEEYVRAHLERRAISETIRRRRIFVCSVCSTPVTELQDQRRRERDFNWLFCSVCGERVSLLDREDRLSSKPHSTIFEMDRAAEVQREANTAISVLEGKIATSDFDVFLAYHHADGRQVEAVAEKLRKQGLNPWLDVEQIPPGQSFQAVIERDILRVRSAAIFFGLNGLGAWQTAELRTLVSRCVERKLPVIPVLLPGVISIPTELLFLHELRAVRFVSSVDENEIINQLVWGITVARPEKLARAEMRS